MLQRINMSHKEKRKMYSKLRKKELIAMLIEANNVIDRMSMPLFISPENKKV